MGIEHHEEIELQEKPRWYLTVWTLGNIQAAAVRHSETSLKSCFYFKTFFFFLQIMQANIFSITFGGQVDMVGRVDSPIPLCLWRVLCLFCALL